MEWFVLNLIGARCTLKWSVRRPVIRSCDPEHSVRLHLVLETHVPASVIAILGIFCKRVISRREG